MGLPLSRVDNNDLTGLLTSTYRYVYVSDLTASIHMIKIHPRLSILPLDLYRLHPGILQYLAFNGIDVLM